MKGFWNKFTTRFAVPLLIVTQVITLYDGWESRIEERADRQQLIHCINSHLHIVGEIHEVIDVDGNKIIFDERKAIPQGSNECLDQTSIERSVKIRLLNPPRKGEPSSHISTGANVSCVLCHVEACEISLRIAGASNGKNIEQQQSPSEL